MRTMKMSLFLIVALCVSQLSHAEDLHNQKLGDVMLLVSDQISALADFQKKAPAEATEKEFARAASRARVSQWLFAKLDKNKGEMVEGDFKPTELTPGKISAATGEEQEALLGEYAEYLSSASEAFAGIQMELGTQLALPAEERDFAALKKANTAVFLVMGKAHKIFKP
ncbi:MAG: hypothetical protein R3B54_04535 [Bdellovibrionota bacterium]